jgi:hypothetical protein
MAATIIIINSVLHIILFTGGKSFAKIIPEAI